MSIALQIRLSCDDYLLGSESGKTSAEASITPNALTLTHCTRALKV